MFLRSAIITIPFLLLSSLLTAQHTNILIGSNNDPNEPSIAINPKNVYQLVAGANINTCYYSFDGGITWLETTLSSSYGVWGDPVIACDTSEAFYFFHLSNPPNGNWIDRIVCQRKDVFGGPWNNGSYAGLNGTKAQDKQWVSIERKTNTIYMTWTEFDSYGSSNPSDSSRILFSRSTDRGDTWSTPVKINEVSGDCIDEDNTTEGAVPAVGPNGEAYVSWAGPAGLVFDRSLDGGNTWLAQDIFVAPIGGGWDYSIPGIYRANGLPVTACDTSGGPHHGTIYINWTDQTNGTTDTDVWLVKSTDGGNTWSQPIMVNNDGTQRHQFFTWMTIDQVSGHLWFVFYDRRNYPDNRTDVYMARSMDGGASFENFKVSQTPFIPSSNIFFGDYTNVTAHNSVVRPIWTRLHQGQTEIYTAIVDTSMITSTLGLPGEQISMLLEQNVPNPFTGTTIISFKLRQPEIITLTIYDFSGRVVAIPLNNKPYAAGKHSVDMDITPATGSYFYELRSVTGVLRRTMVVANEQ